jgi:hypothetical protein
MRSKADLIAELQRHLHDVFVARHEGVSQPRGFRAQGFVDGYMRALLESGLCTQAELLALVAAERTRVSGPPTRQIAIDPASEIAAI